MRFRVPKQLQAAWAARPCRPSGGVAARCAPSDGNLGVSLIGRAAVPPTPSPQTGSRIAALRSRVSRKLDRVQLPPWAGGKKRSACGATQTDPEPRPVLRYRECSTRQDAEPLPLIAQHSSSFQPELKQSIIAKNAEAIAKLQSETMMLQVKLQRSARVVEVIFKLQRDVAELQTKLLQAVRDEAAARRRALRAELQEVSHREYTARGEVESEADKEWETLALAFQASWTRDTDGGAAVDERFSAQSIQACAALPSTSAQLTFPEPTSPRSPTFARECLFIDRICHWVAAFVRRDWARTCSTSAYAVFKVIFQVRDIWISAAVPIGRFQSMGSGIQTDARDFGPEPGLLRAAQNEVTDLRGNVIDTENPDKRWAARFALHMQLTANLYEEMRLRHRQLVQRTSYVVIDLTYVLSTLDEIQKSVDARLAAAEDSEDSTDSD